MWPWPTDPDDLVRRCAFVVHSVGSGQWAVGSGQAWCQCVQEAERCGLAQMQTVSGWGAAKQER